MEGREGCEGVEFEVGLVVREEKVERETQRVSRGVFPPVHLCLRHVHEVILTCNY